LRLSARPEEPANDINKAPVGAVHIVAAFEHQFSKLLWGFLWRIVPDATAEGPVRMLPENFLA
jgi:hypothetical protein